MVICMVVCIYVCICICIFVWKFFSGKKMKNRPLYMSRKGSVFGMEKGRFCSGRAGVLRWIWWEMRLE